MNVINSMAKRDVLKTSRFTSLIKTGKCSAYKTTSGDTSHSVDAIKQIAYKYVKQTEKLAKALLGETEAETVQNNYNFLYQHFQYEADPELQQMRSPNCSWADRFNGIDCKSFSIFASTLLLNQNIAHYIRRIKQPSYNPDNWTHVYIVIPIDQKKFSLDKGYYVIDGTVHTNKEGVYSQKEDTIMSKLPHVWLNGSAEGPISLQYAQVSVGFYNNYLQVLANNGISETVIKSIHNEINSSLLKGETPHIQSSDEAVKINNSVIHLGKYVPGLSSSALNLGPYDFGTTDTGGNNGNNNGGNNGGFNVGGLLSILPIESILGNILSSIGDIFSAGFSCINSTYTPSIVEDRITTKLMPFFEEQINLANNDNIQQSLDQLQRVLKYAMGGLQGMNGLLAESKWRNCSRTSIKYFKEYFERIISEVDAGRRNMINELSNLQYGISSQIQTFVSNEWDVGDAPNTYPGDIGVGAYRANYDLPYNNFDLEIFTITSTPSGETISDLENLPPNETQQAGFGWAQGLLIAGVAGGLLYNYAKKPKSKSK